MCALWSDPLCGEVGSRSTARLLVTGRPGWSGPWLAAIDWRRALGEGERVARERVHSTFVLDTRRSQRVDAGTDPLAELKDFLRKSGGRREDRTPDLRVANAALSQLS